jgi:hypothetical protein
MKSWDFAKKKQKKEKRSIADHCTRKLIVYVSQCFAQHARLGVLFWLLCAPCKNGVQWAHHTGGYFMRRTA